MGDQLHIVPEEYIAGYGLALSADFSGESFSVKVDGTFITFAREELLDMLNITDSGSAVIGTKLGLYGQIVEVDERENLNIGIEGGKVSSVVHARLMAYVGMFAQAAATQFAS